MTYPPWSPGPSGKPRRLPLSSEEEWRLLAFSPEWLAQIIRDGIRTGQRWRGLVPPGINAETVAREFREACDRAGLSGVILHDLRRTFVCRVGRLP